MEPNPYNLPPLKTLWMYFREGLRKANAARPASFYLLLAVPVVLLLGVQLLVSRDNPKHFVFYLSIFFVFFFVILLRAIQDFFDISKRHFFERERLYRQTLGDEEFASQLGEQVSARRDE